MEIGNLSQLSMQKSLREQAEKRMKVKYGERNSLLSEAEMLKIIHELEIHQIELEIQNEELIKARSDIQYAVDLYDLVPSAFFKLSKQGEIIDLNLSGALMLGKQRPLLKNSLFAFFIEDNSKSNFRYFLDKILNSKVRECCELKLLPENMKPIDVSITAIAAIDKDECLLSIIDITKRKQLEEKLIYVIAAVESSTDAIGISDAIGKHFYQNKAYSELFGYATTEELEKAGGGANVINDPSIGKELFTTVMNGKSWCGDLDMITKTGRIFPANESVDAIKDSNGNIQGFIEIISDISDRKCIEKKLKDSEEKYHEIIDQSNDGFLLIDEEGKIEIWNKSMQAFTGLQSKDVIGQAYWEIQLQLAPDEQKYLVLLEKLKCNIKNLLSSNTLWSEKSREQKIKNIDGSYRIVQNSSFKVKSNKGNMIGVTFTDISERKKIEEVLRVSEEKYRYMFANNPQPMLVYDLESLFFMEVNQALIDCYGYSREEFLNMTLMDIHHKEDIAALILDIKSINQNHHSTEEWRTIKKNGEILYIETVSHSVIMDGRKARHVLVNNITDRKQSENQLRESETSMEEAQEIAKMGSWEYNLLTQKTKWSKNYFLLFGLTPNEIEPDFEYFKSRIHIDDLHLIDAGYEKMLKSKKPITLEMRVSLAGGSYKYMQNNIVPFFKDEKIYKLKGTNIDITERKLAEESLQLAKESYFDIFNSVTEAIYLLDESGTFIDVNKGAENMYLYTKQELIGKTPLSVAAEGFNDLDDIQRKMNEVAKTGKTACFDFWAVRKNKEIFPKEVIVNKGKYFGKDVLIATARDISERKRADAEISKSRLQYETLVSRIPVGVYILHVKKDGSFSFDFVSQKMAEMLNQSVENLLLENNYIPSSIHPDDLISFVDLNSECIQKKQAFDWKGRFINEGKIKWMHIVSNPELQESGDMLLHGLIIDITDRIQKEEEIKKKNEELIKTVAEKDKFFSIIAHDLRSPFNSFLGLTQVMAEELQCLTMDQIQKFADSMKNSATHLFRLLENLLEWSRIQQGLIPFKPKIVFLLPIVNESIEMVKDCAQKKQIQLNSDISQDIKVFADTNMLQSTLRNLVSNAVKFTPKGGSINVTARLSQESVEISVKDTGIGISEDMITQLFRLDVNANRKGTEGEASTGLGLIICKDFIEKNGGKLCIESEEENKDEGKQGGSNFYFCIPEKDTCKEKKLNEKQESGKKDSLAQLKVLIAEDDKISEILISMIVKKFAGEVVNARNGLEAVEICRHNPDIDFILMDVQMPEMDGYEATKQIRQFNKNVFIIAQTAFSFLEDKENAIASGCDDYIAKPIKENELKQKMQELMKTRRNS